MTEATPEENVIEDTPIVGETPESTPEGFVPELGTQDVVDDETVPADTVAPAPEGSIESFERDGGTTVSAAFRALTGLDDQPE
jgi:hypothetical protein